MNKPVKTLADTGASHSVVALSWFKYLKLKDQIRQERWCMVDAQKKKIPAYGAITLLVTFGGKEFS